MRLRPKRSFSHLTTSPVCAAYVPQKLMAQAHRHASSPPRASGTAVRLSMIAVSVTGTFSRSGTSYLDIPVGNFSSLLALFSSPITLYSSAQAGLPAQWWANGNANVAFSRPLALPTSSWYNAVPGTPSYQSNCNLQGVNVGQSWVEEVKGVQTRGADSWLSRHVPQRLRRVRMQCLVQIRRRSIFCLAVYLVSVTHFARCNAITGMVASCRCSTSLHPVGVCAVRYRLGIVYNQEADCMSPDSGFGLGGNLSYPGAIKLPVAGQFAGCCCNTATCTSQAAYASVWVFATTPSVCQAVSADAPSSDNIFPISDSLLCVASTDGLPAHVSVAGVLLSRSVQLQHHAGSLPNCACPSC